MSATDTEDFYVQPAPAYQLPPSPEAYQAAHAEADACPHRRTYVVAGRRFCGACGRKVRTETEG